MAMAMGNAGSGVSLQLEAVNPGRDGAFLEECGYFAVSYPVPGARSVQFCRKGLQFRQICGRNGGRREKIQSSGAMDWIINELYNQHLREEANNALHEAIALLRSSGEKESRIWMEFIHGNSPDFWMNEVTVKQEIELFSGKESVIKLVELREELGFWDRVGSFILWLRQLQEQLTNLRLGVACSKRWKDFQAAYMARIQRILVTDLISRRVCCPASIIYKNFEEQISWRRRSGRRGDDECSDAEKYHVECKVDVISWRERFISATITIEADINRVWEVLTDYERLAEFIPNLIHSARIPCPYPGRIWLLQRGLHTAMYWHIEATVVLDLEEFPHLTDGRSLQFCMVDGDFKKYAGRWLLQAGTRPGTTDLHYEVNVIPRLLLPGVFVEGIIKSDLPVNLRAIAERAEKNQRSVIKYPADGGMSVAAPIHSIVSKVTQSTDTKVTSFVQTDDRKYAQRWDNESVTKIKRVCKSDKQCTVDEVHLRRLSEEDGRFWRVVAAVTIAGSMEDVWNVLTSYETLSEFVPNLSSSKIVSRHGNHARVLQEGCKCLLYMVLHARVVLELQELPPNEITFQQVEGDFDVFSGKWTLESLGAEHTLLRYSVDMKMHNDFLLPREIIEEIVYEDLPENLCAIRARVELGDGCYIAKENVSPPPPPPQVREPADESFKNPKRKPVPGLQTDIKVLERELEGFVAKAGKERVMPVRAELRKNGRVDLEKAIRRFGGFRSIAERLNMSLAYKRRKPRGFWQNSENLKREIQLFQKKLRSDPSRMPSRRTLERAGRYDIARALEKWGGLHEVAKVLNLQTKRKRCLEEPEEGWEDWRPPESGSGSSSINPSPEKTKSPHL
ncbi:uncharacterized protein LOC9663170 isoform X1 [Selaginella moellendorffii]|uniref:uncharacterized protein LOC9663170 isoform X1 n=1 Tax=Selaginella moellendorffii TaxID=88036 RepID=UPI000D1CA2ED|nr:uncharacterized protein LOC9663170 isoform X1 [Selaginella moellendorffii]|eukprot:XP_024517251.1 uncharacterized protein LOC9663170 isoform X1 [Selaginella moellendorffii]